MSTDICIYVADLAAYNAGYLHGTWINATLALDEMQALIDTMLAASPVKGAEEYAIHDFEGFGGYRLEAYEPLAAVQEIATFIERYPEFGGALLAEVNDLDRARELAEEGYCGCHSSLADYAQELTEENTSVPQHLAPYIDYQAMARDLSYSGDLLALETGFEQVHVFWNR